MYKTSGKSNRQSISSLRMSHGSAGRDWPARLESSTSLVLTSELMHIQWYLVGRVSLVNQVVGVQVRVNSDITRI